MRILLTSAGGEMISSLAKYIKQDKYLCKPLLFGIDKKRIIKPKNFEKLFTISPKNKIEYYKKILKICLNYKIDLIIPFSDEEAEIFSIYKKFFLKKKIKIMVNNDKCVKLISNKFLTYEKLKKNNIRVPIYYLSKNIKSLKKNIKFFTDKNIDFVIKPIKSRGGRGIIICTNSDQTKSNKKAKRIMFTSFKTLKINDSIFKFGEVMVMEKLNPPGFDIDCFVKNKTFTAVYRKRINPFGIPYKGNIFIKPDKNFYVKKIIKVLKLKYLFDLDFFTDKKGNPILLEANPRPSGSIALCNKVDIPLFSYAISKLMGKNYPKIKFTTKSKKIIKLKI